MASYEIVWRRTTKRDLRRISREQVTKIVEAVNTLKDNPRPRASVKLTGSECAYRIRLGDYRVIYEVYDEKVIVEVVKVGHRREVYR